jgi:hypothetical protein
LASFGLFWPKQLHTTQTMQTRNFVRPLLTQNISNRKTILLKVVALDGIRKAQAVYDL